MPKEYIDRQALTEEILSLSIINNYVAAYADTVLERIQRAPTIDPTHAGGCWISVKDRMPENDLTSSAKQIKVITFIKGKNGYTVRSQLRRKGYHDEWVWKYAAGDVTHWMPLPEPPAEAYVEEMEEREVPKMLNEFAKEVHQVAIEKGWWHRDTTFPEIVAMCHSELSEALEEYRDDRPMLYHSCNAGGPCLDYAPEKKMSCGSRTYNPKHPEAKCSALNDKPEGVAVEMADCILRVLDWAAHENIDLDAILREKHEYNKRRPYRHGGKRL